MTYKQCHIQIDRLELDYVLLFLCFFPFIGPLAGFDSQPFALLFAIGSLICCKKICIKEKTIFAFLVVIISVAVAVALLPVGFFGVAKRLYSYACVLLIPIAIYNSNIDVSSDKFESHVKAYMWVWFVVALIQRNWHKDFAVQLLSIMRTDSMRGVTSLSNEPSFYGYMAFFFLLFSLDFRKNRLLYMGLSVVQMILLAQSTVSIIYLGILGMMYGIRAITKFSFKNMLFTLVMLVLFIFGVYFVMNHYASSRIGSLLVLLIHNPLNVVNLDQSVYERFTSLTDGFNHFPVPGLLGSRTIMSGYGGIVFDLGIFAIIPIIYIYLLLRRGSDRYSVWIIPITLTICMFSAIQLSSPMFAAYIGYCVLKGEHTNNMLLLENNEIMYPMRSYRIIRGKIWQK